MTLEQLMLQVANALGVEHLEPDETGQFSLRFDDKLDVKIRRLDSSTVLLLAVVGHAPSSDVAARDYLERLLTRSLLHLKEDVKEVISLDSETGELLLQRTEDLHALTSHHVQECLEEFTNVAEEWTNYLTDADAAARPPAAMHLLMP